MKILNFNLGDGRMLFIQADHFVSIEDTDGGGSIIRHHGGNVDRRMFSKSLLNAVDVISTLFVLSVPELSDGRQTPFAGYYRHSEKASSEEAES